MSRRYLSPETSYLGTILKIVQFPKMNIVTYISIYTVRDESMEISRNFNLVHNEKKFIVTIEEYNIIGAHSEVLTF